MQKFSLTKDIPQNDYKKMESKLFLFSVLKNHFGFWQTAIKANLSRIQFCHVLNTSNFCGTLNVKNL